MLTDGQLNYKVAFSDLLTRNSYSPIQDWTTNDLLLLRTYLGRELSHRKEDEDASSN